MRYNTRLCVRQFTIFNNLEEELSTLCNKNTQILAKHCGSHFCSFFFPPKKKPSLTVHVRKRPPKHEPQTQQQMNSRNTFEAAYRWPSPSFKLLFFAFHWGNVQSCFCCQLYAPTSQNRFLVLLMKEHFLLNRDGCEEPVICWRDCSLIQPICRAHLQRVYQEMLLGYDVCLPKLPY